MQNNTTMKFLNQNKMKNIHLIPTDKPSRLRYNLSNVLVLTKEPYRDYSKQVNQNIYITNDEEIEDGDWVLIIDDFETYIHEHKGDNLPTTYCKKIILTTDQDLIKDGVQAIDDEFLEWFVKNPSCKFADVNDWMDTNGNMAFGGNTRYQLCNHLYNKQIIPREELKETLEEEKLIHSLFVSETEEELLREFEGESDEEIKAEREKSKSE